MTGKYDNFSEAVQQSTGALLAAVMVINGNKGNGFSVTGTAEEIAHLPSVLRRMAMLMEEDSERTLGGAVSEEIQITRLPPGLAARMEQWKKEQ